MFEEIMDAVPEACPVELVVADKAYDSDEIRESLLDRDIGPVIPTKANRCEPIPHEEEPYKERNRVERLVNKFKQFRRVATRYDKLDITFLAFIQMAAAFIMTR